MNGVRSHWMQSQCALLTCTLLLCNLVARSCIHLQFLSLKQVLHPNHWLCMTYLAIDLQCMDDCKHIQANPCTICIHFFVSHGTQPLLLHRSCNAFEYSHFSCQRYDEGQEHWMFVFAITTSFAQSLRAKRPQAACTTYYHLLRAHEPFPLSKILYLYAFKLAKWPQTRGWSFLTCSQRYLFQGFIPLQRNGNIYIIVKQNLKKIEEKNKLLPNFPASSESHAIDHARDIQSHNRVC